MRVVLQRVKKAQVTVDNKEVRAIKEGFVLLIGFTTGDTEELMQKVANKIISLRIFEDMDGKMNESVQPEKHHILAISQFTLYASVKKGRRPSFTDALEPTAASELYDKFCDFVQNQGIVVERGIFGSDMDVELINDGPVTIIIDSDEL